MKLLRSVLIGVAVVCVALAGVILTMRLGFVGGIIFGFCGAAIAAFWCDRRE